MKNILKHIIAGVALMVLACSCNDFLDIKPLDRMVFEDYWKTANDAEAVVLACYRAMQEDGFMERIILGGELRSDNVVVDAVGESRLGSSEDQKNINDANIRSTNALCKWLDFYRVINYCNAVLKYAPGIRELDPDYTQGRLNAHLAEALTIRALTYFYLVRLYKDVPFIDFPYVEDSQDFVVPQMDGDELLSHIVEDLKTAEIYAIKARTNSIEQRGRVSKNAVRAILADVLLWLGRYDECIEACNRVMPDVIELGQVINSEKLTGAELMLISNKEYNLNSANLFYPSTSTSVRTTMESIFELRFSATNGKNNDKLKELYGSGPTKFGKMMAAPVPEYGLFSQNDFRRITSCEVPQTNSVDKLYPIFKYVGSNIVLNINGEPRYIYIEGSLVVPGWIFYRLPDIYLMRAEAYIEKNMSGAASEDDLRKALADINLIYMRSAPLDMPFEYDQYNTPALLRQLVLDERQREFLFEGKRWFDLLRMARRDEKEIKNHTEMLMLVIRKYETNGGIVQSKLTDFNALYLPVYEGELKANSALIQNPYYK
ncbi:MAG: RagB/SusD family nutrient uptake outer membrane protein [Dysgonamonadaceae bacterium]|jgi:hypothetical protein|nr:RagB/SusD family nutrient uptake outer membrane protein [Dysgonamonadaceae bacterium]